MKRLIIIQNDYAGAGKSTLSQCLHQYLESYRVPHHSVVLVETMDESLGRPQIEADQFKMPIFTEHLNESELVIMEVESGLSQHFSKFYEKHELEQVLPEMGFEMTILVPVTSEVESFDGALEAAETFSDAAQYLVVHTPTSSFYDDDEKIWDKSYPARVMDMFEAVDMNMPVCDQTLMQALKVRGLDLPQGMEQASDVDVELHAEMTKWFRKVAPQLDCVRKYLFGDAFRPAVALAPPEAPKRTRKSRAKAPIMDYAM
jgi:hypothetical protein